MPRNREEADLFFSQSPLFKMCETRTKVYQHVAHDPEYTRAAAERATRSGA